MAETSAPVGKRYPPVTYAVGREKIREYARAVGERDDRSLDVAAARAAGWEDVVAPPMFAVVYTSPAIGPAMFDPEVGIDMAHLVHGAQEFVWDRPVVAGDEITTEVTLTDVRVNESAGLSHYVFTTDSRHADGTVASTGTWTNIVRGAGS